MSQFQRLMRSLHEEGVRYCMIGVWGANLHAENAGMVFTTYDRDLFIPRDAPNLAKAWDACERAGLELTCGREELDRPRDLWLAERVVEQRALTRAHGPDQLLIDLTLVMGEFEFEDVWPARREFVSEGVPVLVASLAHIVASKAQAGRPKDALFLETHKEALRDLLRSEGLRNP